MEFPGYGGHLPNLFILYGAVEMEKIKSVRDIELQIDIIDELTYKVYVTTADITDRVEARLEEMRRQDHRWQNLAEGLCGGERL
jgi:hypothetical protein